MFGERGESDRKGRFGGDRTTVDTSVEQMQRMEVTLTKNTASVCWSGNRKRIATLAGVILPLDESFVVGQRVEGGEEGSPPTPTMRTAAW